MTESVVHALVGSGVTHLCGIPDNTSGPLFHEIRRHPSLRLVTSTREGEAIAIAAGLWMGGAQPIVVIQNTGLLESGDAIRGTILRMAAPVPILITARGYAKMRAAGVSPDDPKTIELLTRPDVDSTALLTEPTLDAWGIPFQRCAGDDDPADAVRSVVRTAEADQRPIALIMERSLA